jgi:hypothetical protein
MNRITPYAVWIGNEVEGREVVRLLDEGVEAIVDLAAESPARATPRDLIYCRFPLIDGVEGQGGLVALAVRTVAALVAAETPTFVGCGAGLSRAPAVVAAALAVAFDQTPEFCLERVRESHRCDVAPRLWSAVLAALPAARRVTV